MDFDVDVIAVDSTVDTAVDAVAGATNRRMPPRQKVRCHTATQRTQCMSTRRSTSHRRASSRPADPRFDDCASTNATVARVFLPYEHLKRRAKDHHASLTRVHLYGFTRVNDANCVDIVCGAYEDGRTELIGRLHCGGVSESDDENARKKHKVWLVVDVGDSSREDVPPKVLHVYVSSARIELVQVIICPMPEPPLSVFALSNCDSSGDLSQALAKLNSVGAAKFFDAARKNNASSRSRGGLRATLARFIVPCVDAILAVINYQFMHSLGSEPRWGGGFTRRSLCEIFASACVLRQRLCFIRGVLLEPLNWHNLDLLQRRRALARAFQITFDLLLGVCITYCMLSRIDVQDALKRRLILGGTSRRYSSGSYLIGTDTIEKNADWISRGDPLGFKLHVPLAKRLGALAVTFVHSVAMTARHPQVTHFMMNWFRLSILSAGVFGASMVFALLADITTTVTMHIAALHVYSSLFITAQLRLIRFLYRRYINPKKSATSFKLADEVRARTVEEVIIGTLSLPPLLLLFPTVFFYYCSYLSIHAATVAARLVMVLLASTLLNFPTDIVLVRLWTPHAFPSSMRLEKTEIHGVRYVALRPIAKSMREMLAPFTEACSSWLYSVLRAVLRAIATCGRFPITLVPFTLDAY